MTNVSKGSSTGGKINTAEEGNNRFPASEGEVVFSHVFEDHDKIRGIEMHSGFCSNPLVNCLVSNIILPLDKVKMNAMTCSKLDQFASGSKY